MAGHGACEPFGGAEWCSLTRNGWVEAFEKMVQSSPFQLVIRYLEFHQLRLCFRVLLKIPSTVYML
jgi:hypothetical protein